MEIRRAERRDFNVLCRLYGQVDAWHHQAYPDRFKFSGKLGRALGLVQKEFADPSNEIWVVEAEGKVRGMGSFLHRQNESHPLIQPGSFLLVDVIVVHEAWQGKGIGKMVLDKAKSIAEEKGYGALRLKVYEKNESARRMYASQGFEPIISTMELKVGE